MTHKSFLRYMRSIYNIIMVRKLDSKLFKFAVDCYANVSRTIVMETRGVGGGVKEGQ